ncbi:MAG: PQQ-dependent sugar dehydrogenase [Verrucomicrobiota bacterium]|nr:PQQ-dependent sugar dehydrogenase [Verrucomicrobiota bacterium]
MTRLWSLSWRWFVFVALCAGIFAPFSLRAADPEKGLSPEAYRKHAMTRSGNVKKGEEIFGGRKALCSQCHSTDGSNRLAGPDLKAAGDKFSREDLILSVLQPSSSIMTGFALSVVTTRDGSKYSGVVKQSSSQELVIAGMGELRHRIAKAQIKEQVTSPVSMMPANLHAALSQAEFTDLVTYLESLKDERSRVRNERGTPLDILRLEKPVRLVPFLGDGLDLEKPVWFGEHPVINDRFVILEKSRARISLLKRKPDGPATRSLFVEIPEEVYVTNDEGLLGMAFHPNFAENRRYYFMHEVKEGARRGMVVGEREARADLMADSGKPTRTVLEFDVATEFHHGGGLEFGPDGYLYIGMGDGGPQEDPHGHAQDLTSFSGKLMRIDVDRRLGGKGYAIPEDNPFATHANPDVRREIFAYGLRQPWRFSFDPANGELWVGDVGQNRFEEVAIVRSGENHGWNVLEGFELFSTRYRKENARFIAPVVSFRRKHGVSITGGYVFRSLEGEVSSFDGVYICADYQSKRIWGIRHKDRKLQVIREIGNCPDRVVSFGRDRNGSLYAVGYDKGVVYSLDFGGAEFK